MLDRLPVDLLSLVLRLAAPSTTRREEYYAGQATLRSLTLTCKRLDEVARRILWDVVRLETFEQAKQVKQADQGGARRTGTRRLKVIDGRNVLDVTAAMLSLQELWLETVRGGLSLFNLCGLTSLKRLVLFDLELTTPAAPSFFPHLEALSLCSLRTTPSILYSFLRSETLPALRALVLNRLQTPDSAMPFCPFLPHILITALDVLELSPDVLEHAIRDSLHGVNLLVPLSSLLNLNFAFPSPRRFHLVPPLCRWLTYPGHEADPYRISLYRFLLSAFTVSPGAHVLVLPLDLRPYHRPSDGSGFSVFRDNVLRLCYAQQIRVLWTPEQDAEEVGVVPCVEFWRLVRKEREAERREQ
ncbi:hypothetical protein JCM10213_005386 [Rhodosporidiobolus nylandii]